MQINKEKFLKLIKIIFGLFFRSCSRVGQKLRAHNAKLTPIQKE